MAGQANEPILQLQAEVLALQEEAAIAEAFAVTAAAAATAATATTTAAVQQAAGAARSPPVFTLASALANAAAFLDLTGSSGAKRFKGATPESLSFQPFDFEDNSDPRVFLDLVLTKSQVWGWNTIFNVPVTDAATGAARNWNLLSHHSMAPLGSARIHATLCCATPLKQAQDSCMMNLLMEMKAGGIKTPSASRKVLCKLLKTTPPRTRHVNQKHHAPGACRLQRAQLAAAQ
jgi:hypothetical protein